MFGTADPSGPLPFGFPARNRALSVAMVMVRGVWHSPQWDPARVRYSPRGAPDVGADVGGYSRGAKVASHPAREPLSNMGTSLFLARVWRFTGGSDRRYATTSFRSCSAMPLKTVYGCTGISRSPFGRRPARMAVMI